MLSVLPRHHSTRLNNSVRCNATYFQARFREFRSGINGRVSIGLTPWNAVMKEFDWCESNTCPLRASVDEADAGRWPVATGVANNHGSSGVSGMGWSRNMQHRPDVGSHVDVRGRPHPFLIAGSAVVAAPTVRHLARKLGIDLSGIHGTGPVEIVAPMAHVPRQASISSACRPVPARPRRRCSCCSNTRS